METITFRCNSCQANLKVGADKAGRKVKCSKCGTVLTIPTGAPAPTAPRRPESAPVAAAKMADSEDNDEAGYGLKEMTDLGEQRREKEREAAAVKPKTPGRKTTVKKALIVNPAAWRKTGLGMQIIAGGMCLWMAAYLLGHVPLVLGLTVGEEYAKAADQDSLVTSPINAGKAPTLNLAHYGVSLLTGSSLAGTMVWTIRLSLLLYLLAFAVLLGGYAMCLPVPRDHGTRLQLGILIALALGNALFLLIFKLLPMFGVMSYVILPLAVPEVMMTSMNAERMESVFTFWLTPGWAVIEVYWAIVVTVLFYFEPAMIATFMYTVGVSVKSPDLESKGLKAMKLAYAQVFIQAIWLASCLCGSSVVLIWALRAIYALGMGFLIYQFSFTVASLMSAPRVIEDQLGDEAAAAEGEEENEES